MLTVVITGGLVLMLAGGIWQLSNVRLAGPDARRTTLVSPDAAVFSPRDLRSPWRILADNEKLRNAAMVAMEFVVVVASVWMATYVVAQPGVTPALKALVVATLGVGATLVGHGTYVRLGLYRPDLSSVEDYRDSIAVALDGSVAEDFAGIQRTMATARGDEEIDAPTVSVLAAARQGRPLDEVVRWGEGAGVADPETFENRAATLADAGLIDNDGGRLELAPDFEDADPDQIATVAATLLN